ncbi:glutathione S-transferase D7-like [Diorhabda carinulata]|uniref:glutathione S-transferase D7-like n=1 Tax=Diorhabda carinulata TaxID=1163345 RepID=UPI0025A1562B|nr:glutathione S-transferase D7-like [Diorhabda carinulata]
MSNHAIDIYFFTMSPPSRSVLLLMKTLGLRTNIKTINILNGEQFKPEFIKVNPLHTIPTINDDGFVLSESNAILKYLVDQYGKDDKLFPKDNKKGAIVNQMLNFGSSTLLPRFAATHFALMMGGTVDEQDKEKLKEAFDYLNNFLKESKWLAGENMTVADIAIHSILGNIVAAGIYDLQNYPNLWQWFERTKNALSQFGYEEIMQAGSDAFGHVFKTKVNA